MTEQIIIAKLSPSSSLIGLAGFIAKLRQAPAEAQAEALAG